MCSYILLNCSDDCSTKNQCPECAINSFEKKNPQYERIIVLTSAAFALRLQSIRQYPSRESNGVRIDIILLILQNAVSNSSGTRYAQKSRTSAELAAGQYPYPPAGKLIYIHIICRVVLFFIIEHSSFQKSIKERKKWLHDLNQTFLKFSTFSNDYAHSNTIILFEQRLSRVKQIARYIS